MKNRNVMNAERWCRYFISASYKVILINVAVLIAVWYFFASDNPAIDQGKYWVNYIILPSLGMLVATFLADFLVRSDRLPLIAKEYITQFLILFFCVYLCFVHSIVAVLLAVFIVPVLISTIFSNMKMTRLTFILSLIFLLLSGLKMHLVSTRDFDFWIWVELITAYGLLIVSYLLAKVLIVYGQDSISNLNHIYDDKLSLEKQLQLDHLTGLNNRKAYDEVLPQLIAECRTANLPLSIAVLDLDDFKQINDIYGHVTGDRALLKLTGIFRRNMPENTYVFRVGGEEFVLLFRDYHVDEAAKICESLLFLIRSSSLPEMNGEEVTFSCGVAGMDAHLADPVSLFKAADSALYSAKNNGKNQVVMYDKERQSQFLW